MKKNHCYRLFLLAVLFLVLSKGVFPQNYSCQPNIDFEYGSFQNWQCYIGSTSAVGTTNVISVSPSAPIVNRHTIISSTSNGVMDPYGNFPVRCPNGSSFSVKLGNNQTGAQAERISYTFTVPDNVIQYSIIYQYAVVFQNPNHQPYQQPRFTAKVLDVATNQYVSCATFDYVATANIPGFQHSNVDPTVWYKSWTPVTINLTSYAGRTIILEFTTADCTLGGHFGYAYIDVNTTCASPILGSYYCPNSTSITLTAPYGYQSYHWFDQNFNLLGTQQTLTLSPPPPVNTVIAVEIIPYAGFGCPDTIYTSVQPASPPVANAGPDKNICVGNAVNIGTGPPNLAYTYKWSPSAGLNDSTLASPIASPATTTTYVLTVTDIVTGCSTTDSVTVNVSSVYTGFVISPSSNQCVNGNNFSFTYPDTLNSILWKFGDGNMATSFSTNHSYLSAGNYSVKLIATNPLGCADSSTKNVTVYAQPLADFNAPASVCYGAAVNFTDQSTVTNSSIIHWTWNFGDGTSDTIQNPSHNYQNPGTYNVTLTVNSAFGCTSVPITKSVTINAVAIADFKTSSPACATKNVLFIDSSSVIAGGSIAKWYWDFGDGSQETDTTNAPVNHIYANTGTYIAKLKVEAAGGCQSTVLSKAITVNATPFADFTFSKACLPPGTTQFTNQSSISDSTQNSFSYSWNFGDGATSNIQNPSHNYSSVGPFNVSLRVISNKGCIQDTAKIMNTVYPIPTGNLTTSANVVCEGIATVITATGGTAYNWFKDGVSIATNSADKWNALQAGVYTAEIISAEGCKNMAANSITLGIIKKPTSDFSFDKYCVSTPVSFTNKSNTSSSGPVDYSWDLGNGINSSLQSVTTMYNTPGSFNVSLTVTPQICPQISTTTQKIIAIEEPRKGTTYYPLNAVAGRSLQLSARNFGANYLWMPGIYLNNPLSSKPVYTGTQEQVYEVKIIAPSGCVTTDTQLVRIFKGKDIFVPKAFTPNGDGVNDKMYPFLVGIKELKSFRIINRWGVIVFETKNDQPGWDGTFNGKPQPMDGYIWEAEAIDMDGNVFRKTGNFTLIR